MATYLLQFVSFKKIIAITICTETDHETLITPPPPPTHTHTPRVPHTPYTPSTNSVMLLCNKAVKRLYQLPLTNDIISCCFDD